VFSKPDDELVTDAGPAAEGPASLAMWCYPVDIFFLRRRKFLVRSNDGRCFEVEARRNLTFEVCEEGRTLYHAERDAAAPDHVRVYDANGQEPVSTIVISAATPFGDVIRFENTAYKMPSIWRPRIAALGLRFSIWGLIGFGLRVKCTNRDSWAAALLLLCYLEARQTFVEG
jgi:hypothetical protein